jgi:hypothetical protein
MPIMGGVEMLTAIKNLEIIKDIEPLDFTAFVASSA